MGCLFPEARERQWLRAHSRGIIVIYNTITVTDNIITVTNNTMGLLFPEAKEVCVCVCVCVFPEARERQWLRAHSGATYSGVTVVLKWCYSSGTVVLQCCGRIRDVHKLVCAKYTYSSI
jgi:hypothetical protein